MNDMLCNTSSVEAPCQDKIGIEIKLEIMIKTIMTKDVNNGQCAQVNNKISIIFGGHQSSESKRQNKLTSQYIVLPDTSPLTYYWWFKTLMRFSRPDHWCHLDMRGKYPLVVVWVQSSPDEGFGVNDHRIRELMGSIEITSSESKKGCYTGWRTPPPSNHQWWFCRLSGFKSSMFCILSLGKDILLRGTQEQLVKLLNQMLKIKDSHPMPS